LVGDKIYVPVQTIPEKLKTAPIKPVSV